MMVTLGVGAAITSMAVLQIGHSHAVMKGDAALRVLVAQLNLAREQSITQRRNMQVNFVGTNQVQVVRQNVPTGTTVLAVAAFEGGVQFGLVSGIPDTPDGFGKNSAIDFGTATSEMFSSDGTLIDQNGNPVTGTVFFRLVNAPKSFRAVTFLGATGRIRAYRWNGAGWVMG
jgi:hypothetical protein